jgi:AcrR family transcriptional regulator
LSRRPPPKLERRTPKQERSARRRDEILEAAGRLLDRIGYDGTTTTAIAKEAEASVGTVYEYFPDREVLVRALLERYRERLRTAVMESLSGAEIGSWRLIARRSVDTFAAFYQREPGYRVLWLESQTSPALREAGAAWGDEFSELLAGAFGFASHLTPKRRLAIARTCTHLVSALTSMALAGPPDLMAATLRETKIALEAYLEHVLSPH